MMHPRGTHAIAFFNTDGNHVSRHNECVSDSEHMFQDVIGGGTKWPTGQERLRSTGWPHRDRRAGQAAHVASLPRREEPAERRLRARDPARRSIVVMRALLCQFPLALMAGQPTLVPPNPSKLLLLDSRVVA